MKEEMGATENQGAKKVTKGDYDKIKQNTTKQSFPVAAVEDEAPAVFGAPVQAQGGGQSKHAKRRAKKKQQVDP